MPGRCLAPAGKWSRSFFLQMFVPNESTLALLSTTVAQMLQLQGARQTNRCEIVINTANLTAGEHSIGRRTTFSPNLYSSEEDALECLPILQH